MPVTHAGLWALVLVLTGYWPLAAALCVLRILAGLAAAVLCLDNRALIVSAPLIPLWDLWAFAVWVAGAMGRTVLWRGERLRLRSDGRIPGSGAGA